MHNKRILKQKIYIEKLQTYFHQSLLYVRCKP